MNQELHTGYSLPYYSAAEERFNMRSHLLGIIVGFAMIILSLFFSHSVEGMLTGTVFGGTLVLLYMASSIYHGLPVRYPRIKAFFRIVDHCSIFLLCAGTCTPFLYSAFQGAPGWQGWLFNASIWMIALLGIVLLAWDIQKYKKLSSILYVLIGLILLSQGNAIRDGIGEHGYILLLAGGIVYLAGLVIYSIKKPWMHAVFHVLCLIASILHCACVAAYII